MSDRAAPCLYRVVEEDAPDCTSVAFEKDAHIRGYVDQLKQSGAWALLAEEFPVDSTLFVPAAATTGEAGAQRAGSLAGTIPRCIPLGPPSLKQSPLRKHCCRAPRNASHTSSLRHH